MRIYKEVAFAVAALLLLAVIVRDETHSMGMAMMFGTSALAAVFIALFSLTVLYERPRDERESLHMLASSRLAYISAVGFFAAAIIYQGLAGFAPDPILLIGLFITLAGKIIGTLYANWRH